MSQQMYAFEPQTFADSGFSLRALRVLRGKICISSRLCVKSSPVSHFQLSIFRFQLNAAEKNELVTNCDRFENLKHSSINPCAFTEHGVSMLSAVLRSDIAVKISIQIMNAFVEMRKFIANNAGIFQRLDKVELKQIEADHKFEQIFKALESGSVMPRPGPF